MKLKRFNLIINLLLLFIILTILACNFQEKQNITEITVNIPKTKTTIDPMIYGQMLEDCNDQIIYDGIADMDGREREHITKMLKPLTIPIVRWPAGSYMHEYHWERGVGPLENRPIVECFWWGGIENHRFGTDEFLAWCKNVETTPYININMGNQPPYAGTLEEALNWIEYVNGSKDTPYGKKRIKNGHTAPYHVEYWCIGNENYGPWGRHTTETAEEYSTKLNQWAKAIKSIHQELKLLAVGYTPEWNDTVLTHNGELIDYLTQHYYITSTIRDGKIENPENTTFAPVVVEEHLQKIVHVINKHSKRLNRTNNPIKISVDEWNNRHLVFDNETENFIMRRHDERLLTDVTVISGMLNIFIRNSPILAMGNYIFPVNGHGLIKTVGENDAYKTSIYYVFELYRKLMHGNKLELAINGGGKHSEEINFAVEFGQHNEEDKLKIDPCFLNYVDGVAVLTEEGKLNLALINRSAKETQNIKLQLPKGYQASKQWLISHTNINAHNDAENRNEILPQEINLKKNTTKIKLLPCALTIIQFEGR